MSVWLSIYFLVLNIADYGTMTVLEDNKGKTHFVLNTAAGNKKKKLKPHYWVIGLG